MERLVEKGTKIIWLLLLIRPNGHQKKPKFCLITTNNMGPNGYILYLIPKKRVKSLNTYKEEPITA